MVAISGYALQKKMRNNHNIDTYYAIRSKDRCPVLLKTPNNHHVTAENLAVLQHEFNLLQQLDAPTIIKAYDFLQDIPVPILILENVEGLLLHSYLKDNRLDIGDFCKLALQLVDIIGELHQLKIIHKEINPSNIIINPDKLTLKLIDLSVCSQISEETFEYMTLNNLEEDLAYISPEQTGRINRPIDYRTDFYSLGVTLYQMLTNQLPFQSNDPLELVHCHIAKKAPPAFEKRSDVPEMLNAIIDKLLNKMPESRYSSIIGLKSDLQACQEQWERQHCIKPFTLGLNDTRDYLSISRNLYGRNAQVGQLLQAFNRVSKGNKEIVLIAGYSGIGKTSLVNEVHKAMVQHRVYYIQGKFDQIQRNIPYSGIVSAFQKLVKQVLAQSEEHLNDLRTNLLHSLGKVGQVIIDVIPEIELIIGAQPSVPKLNPNDTQIRFNLAVQNLIRVFAQQNHPLVIFLDDLQWADNSSLHFIENLLQDQETNYLLLLGAYRNNEISEEHPLQQTLNNISNNNVARTQITLEPLELKNIQQLLHDTLLSSVDKIQELAQCVFEKTEGNPFFINEFIKLLYQNKLLHFSYEQGCWEWDLAKILQQSATDNVLDLLTTKIHWLPQTTQEILMLAACLGHKFDFATLVTISEKTISQTADGLYQAIKANLIYPIDGAYLTENLMSLEGIVNHEQLSTLYYRFVHDRIQQASSELVEKDELPYLHLKIGRLLLKEKELTENDERLFEVMKHFNQGLALIKGSSERLQLAKYNLWAGQKAKSASAYYAANEYFSAGISLLPENYWQNEDELAFQLYKELAACKYLIGDFINANDYFNQLLDQEKNPLKILEINRLKIEMLATLGKHREALNLGLNALKSFGIQIPKNPKKYHLLIAIYRIKFQLKRTRPEFIDLPLMSDLKQKAIVNLIAQLLNSAFIIEQKMFILLTCINVRLSLKHGYTESTSMCIPVYAFVLMHSLYLHEEALSFVRLYNKLKQKYGASNFEGRNQFLLGEFIEPYQLPMSECNKTIINAFKLGCEAGDLGYSNYSNLALISHSFIIVQTLDEIKGYVDATLSFMARTKISDFGNVTRFWGYSIQCLKNLEAIQPEQLAAFEQRIIQGENKTELGFFYCSIARLHFLFGNIDQAVQMGQKHEIYSDYDKGLITHFDGKFYYALALCQYLHQLPKKQHKPILKKIKQLKQLVDRYTVWCPDNFKMHSLLLEAELAQLNNQDALPFYDEAINRALSSKSILIAAIASERAGSYCITQKVGRVAQLYLQNAYQLFKKWGALAKAQWLEDSYPTYITNETGLAKPLLSQRGGQNLDMLAMLKFTQLLSSEIRLDKLLQKFITIVLENSGAQNSIILTRINAKWIIEAEGNSEEQNIYLNNLKETDPGVKYPLSVLNYVQLTKKAIIINDTNQSDLTFNDIYVQKEKPKSILAMPIFYQGQLCHILYLEHKDSNDTFTSSHIDSLQLLSSQAMTSLENAKLYYQVSHDPLTGLANRNMLYELFQQTAIKASPSGKKIALLFLDLDYFKMVNDNLGHDYGDKLLIHTAKILNSILMEGDIAARMGGDEFVVMLTHFNSKEYLTSVVEWICHELSKPFHVGDHILQTTTSLGISIFPDDAEDIQTLLKFADTALYQAKEKGRNQFYYYSTQLLEDYQRTHGLDKELQRAYENQEFFLMYQPFYALDTGAIIGLEALIRWKHPEKGVLEAKDFITTLESSPLISPVSEWVLKTACQQAKIWQEKKIFSGFIAINLSATQFLNHSISSVVADVLAETQFDPAFLELEITETIVLTHNENLYKEIKKLQQLGVNLVLDDFGTGYSALSYLKLLPVNKIKIDKMFIDNCAENSLDQTIIHAITTMAHKLNMKVIAEGVENEQQLNTLHIQGIDGFQGYVYSRPLTSECCETYLDSKKKS
ncbi:EAL domain-containing protein [Legionella rowbothamii]|uniref:EAL domain-containing protein n=1 Tax=Legionella rowbothamii TaxID=96229 RepID=UPI001056361D|nr:EAL domain-containing protein [Legionella rowbothamii]